MKVALLAMEVSEAALSALAATSAALECHEQRIEPLVKSRDCVQPVQPETPQLLPIVHSLWAPLLQALKVLPFPPIAVSLPMCLTMSACGNIIIPLPSSDAAIMHSRCDPDCRTDINYSAYLCGDVGQGGTSSAPNSTCWSMPL